MKKMIYSILRFVKSVSFIFVLLMYSFQLNAQTGNAFAKAIDFLPPPPNATAIIKHDQLGINKNTGSPNISIPLYPIKGFKLNLGISLNYASTGIKVDEISSRVGMGWSIQAGGVLTRTVRGTPDELNTRFIPPSVFSYNYGTYAFFGQSSTQMSPLGDSQPDLFHFSMNGISGSFIFDQNMQPVILEGNKYKVASNFVDNNDWNFKITTTDGIAYYFGGSTAIEKTRRQNVCGQRNYDGFLPVSWYLKKIENTNGETILLNYTPITYNNDTGVSETQRWQQARPEQITAVYNTYCNECQTQFPLDPCVNYVTTQGVLLSSVISSTNDSLQISYVDRTDCNDKLISEIRYSGNEGNYGRFTMDYMMQTSNPFYNNETYFGYNKTPYLNKLSEYSSTGVLSNQHLFYYNDPASRPSRLSYSQDHWGYFNGIRNLSTLIPKPETADLITKFPLAVANREAQEGFAAKGLLSKIVYPAGGVDSIVYESNKYASFAKNPNHVLIGQATGTGLKTAVIKTYTFTILYQQSVELEITGTLNEGELDIVHHKGSVVLTGTSEIFRDAFVPDYTNNVALTLDPGTYTLKIQSNGTIVSTNVVVRYKNLPPGTGQVVNQVVGGSRVKYVISQAKAQEAEVHRYYYGLLNSKDLSSLSAVRAPIYVTPTRQGIECTEVTATSVTAVTLACIGTQMYSSSLSNVYDFSGSSVSYQSVLESYGEDFEQGGIQSIFSTTSDAPGQVLWGNDIPEAPRTNSSNLMNGKIQEETVFKKSSTGALIPINKKNYSYKIVDLNTIRGFVVKSDFQFTFGPGLYENFPPEQSIQEYFLLPFHVIGYDVLSAFVYNDSLTVKTYDTNGLNPVTSITAFAFDNPLHRQVTQNKVLMSDGSWKIELYKYPHDFISEATYAQMVTKNMISPVIDVVTYRNDFNTKLSELKMNYADWGNGNLALSSVQNSFGNGSLVNQGVIDSYNSNGNILQYRGSDGIVNAIIWGGSFRRYPIAKITGDTYNHAISYLSVPETSLASANEQLIRDQVDLIRTGIPSAQVTTYSYKKKVGVSSITDPRKDISTFVYDSKDRFSVLFDKNNDILKTYSYSFGIPENYNITVFYNQAVSGTFSCQTCAIGYAAPSITYSIPVNTVFSTISVADANMKANLLLQQEGQLYANQSSTCYNVVQ